MGPQRPAASQDPIADLIDRAEAKPDSPALIGSGGTVTYGALLRGVRSGAAWLHEAGVRAGDTLAYALEFKPALLGHQVALLYGAGYLGAAILPLYPEAAAVRRGQMAARFNARWLISSSAIEAAGATRLDPAQFDSGRRPDVAAPRGDDPARPFLYEFSSGTTGTPKVVLFTAAQYAANNHAATGQYGWRESDLIVCSLRWPAKVGLRGLLRVHSVGAAYVDEPFPETRSGLARLVDQLGVTCVRSSPWQLRRLIASAPPAGPQARAPRCLNTVGAYIAPHEIRAARETLAANFHVGYACTELGMIAHLGPGDPFDAAPKLIPGMQGVAVDDAGRALPPGEPGLLRFRAPWMTSGYVGNEQATAANYRDGWFGPGDSGSVDAAGRVVLFGRSDDVINFGGAKVPPHDVERELRAHPEVVDVAVVGLPEPMAGEIPVAFVVLRSAVALEALQSWLAERLDRPQMPGVIIPIERIPRNAEGKVLRERLREDYSVSTASPEQGR